jgi:hypothetical protein
MRPTLLQLEERRLLATFLVSSLNDSGPGTLRAAVEAANAAKGANTVEFSLSSRTTISLTSGQLVLNDSGLTITADPAAGLTISANGLNRVFEVSANVTASISGLTITGGGGTADRGGGLLNLSGANLTLTGCTISGDKASGSGGGLANYGNVTLTNCSFNGNLARNGGGVFNAGTATLTDCELFYNSSTQNGGGLVNNGIATVTRTTFTADRAAELGGGIYNNATLSVNNSTLNIETAGGAGGGLYNAKGTATLSNSTLSNDAAIDGSDGGAIYNNATVVLNSCNLSDDGASGNGGGVSNNASATLTNCTLNGDSAGGYGGGFYNNGGVLFTNCTLDGDSANGYGGGLYNANGKASFSNSTLSNDSAGSEFYGGAIYNNATLNVTNSTFSFDSAGGYGGGLYNANGTATLSSSTFSNDSAGHSNARFYGGGIYNYATLFLTNCSVVNDQAGGYGGGLYNANGTATVTNSTFSNNKAGLSSVPYYGGGIYNNAALTLTNCTVNNNSANGYGGGLYNNSGAKLTNCTFTGNSAGNTYYGGGLYNNSVATLVSCTFSNNSATYGGGLYNNSNASLINTIIAGNAAPSGGPDVYRSVTSLGHNLIGNTDGSSGWVSSDLTNMNALLAPLAFYGGPTQTLALLPRSPAIQNGIASGVSTDQRGFALDSPPDIGAFQVQSGPLALQVNTTADGSGVPSGKLDLRGAIYLANSLSGDNTISFSPSVFTTAQTIKLTSGQLELSNTSGTVTITGPAVGVTVSGGGQSRVFQVDQSVTASISGLTITGGGGLPVDGCGLLIQAAANLTLTNCTISGNSASGSGGGLFNYGTLTGNNCTISGNTASGSGGGLFNDNIFGTALATLANCTITGNTANQGGGLYNHLGATTLTNCTISNNTATAAGGGLFNRGKMSVTNCTITANTGGSRGGGGLFNFANPMTLTNTIVAGNTKGSIPTAPDDIAGAVPVSGRFNLIGTGGSGGLMNGVDGNIVGVADPGLAKLGYYGGPTQTMALLPGSAAIGAGTTISGITTDQRGLPLDNPPDIGAFQVQSGLLALQVNTTVNGTFGKLDLRGAVGLANGLPGSHTITFSPTVFAAAQTITLTTGQLELSNTSGTQTITGPAAGVTITGGGLNRVFQFDRGVTASISGLTITGGGGTADRGGGLLNLTGANLTLTNCTVTGNTASRTGGGLANYGTATLISCSVAGNNTKNGGGLFNFSGRTMTLTNCTVSGNKAGMNGGGLANYGSLILTNCTVSNNSATNGGGLLGNGTMTVTSCTISGNSASSGGGMQSQSGSAAFTDTIVARNTNNSNPPGASDIAGASIVTGVFNLIGTGGSGGLTNGVNGNIVGVTDPDLGSLGPYGGATQTMALLPGSAAIGKGIAIRSVTTDQRGLPRGTLVDIGAYQTTLLVKSTAGPVNTDPAQLTLAGAVNLANALAGPIAIGFDPKVFTGGQTITLTGGLLELSRAVPIFTITGPAAGVTINGGNSSNVFQIDKTVTAYISGLTMSDNSRNSGAALMDLGTATLTNCIFSAVEPSSATAIQVSGGTLEISGSEITRWRTGIQATNNATTKIAETVISGNGTGVVVGSSSSDSCSVTVQRTDLSGNTVGVQNNASRPIDATFNWWGNSNGPGAIAASAAVGNVLFSPWLGDVGSLSLTTPNSLGFTAGGTTSTSYVVTPAPNGPNLRITQVGSQNAPWTVTPNGTVIFVGSGGSVTLNGQPGTDAFRLTDAAIRFAAADAFNGATIEFNGNISREIDAKGTTNDFDVSAFSGAATLTSPITAGTVSTLAAFKTAGYTLTNASLSSTDGMKLALKGITTANLTSVTTSGNANVIVDASAFSGVTNLAANGNGKAVLFGGGRAGKMGGTLTVMGSGNDVLVGGPGANTLTDQSTGFNILIGGGGPNTITGNGNDILISGTTSYDSNTSGNILALDAILAEWSSTEKYATRISRISNGMIPGGYALNASTVKSNGQTNTVSDGLQPTQQNWFIITRNDFVTAKANETLTTIPA